MHISLKKLAKILKIKITEQVNFYGKTLKIKFKTTRSQNIEKKSSSIKDDPQSIITLKIPFDDYDIERILLKNLNERQKLDNLNLKKSQ